ncbi:MAG TPA: TRAP transporter substrate-binding protein [Burkholderiales bacterium]|nr:TRAP transporter substrate-binding protein [Burkholderiales bacterium]
MLKRTTTLLAMLCGALALGACQKGAEQGAKQATATQPGMHWKMQSYWQSGTLPQQLFERFAQEVKTASNGRLVIEALATNAVVAPPESLDAVAAGVLDGHNGGPAYFTGKDAAFALIGDPQGAFDNPYQMQMWMEYGGGNELSRELYAKFNVQFVGGVWYGVESLVSKKPLRTLADFKGLKIRAPQGMSGDIFSRLGAAPVQLPGSEVYTALERGVVDASDWGTLSMNDDLGYHKLAKYPTFPGFHSMPMGEISVNKAKWDALPADLKAIVEAATRDYATAMIQRNYLADITVAVEAPKRGIEPTDLPAAERQKFREIARGVWKEYAGRSPMAQKVYDSQIAFLKRLGLLKE